METIKIRDLGWKKVGSGIRDKHPGSATLGKLIQKMDSSYLLDYRLLHYDSLEVLASFWPFAAGLWIRIRIRIRIGSVFNWKRGSGSGSVI
jgi:hypothetical protein